MARGTRAAKLPPYKARRRQRERAAFVQSIHGGDIRAASMRDGAHCAPSHLTAEVCGSRGVGANTAAPELARVLPALRGAA